MYNMAEQYLRNLKNFKHRRPLVARRHLKVFETFTKRNNKGISRKVILIVRTVYALAAV